MDTPRPRSRADGPPLRLRDPDDPAFKAVELAQRGRMILDVAAADLEAAEAALGPFHPTAWFFRNALAEARRSWDRLRAEYGGAALSAALEEPPVAILTLDASRPGGPRATLIAIAGKTYRAERMAGTELAPALWRLTRLPLQDDGPCYVSRLNDNSTQCDCAEWTYQIAEGASSKMCKHLAALASLGWL
jgi:hypothetical protein